MRQFGGWLRVEGWTMRGFAGFFEAGVIAVCLPDFLHLDILIRPRRTKLTLCCGKFEGGVGQFGTQANMGLWDKRENVVCDPIFYHYG